MEVSHDSLSELVTTSTGLTQRLLTIGENRLELLTVEFLQEEECLLQVMLLAFGVALFAILGGMGLVAVLAILLWPYSPLSVVLIVAIFYAAVLIYVGCRLRALVNR